MSTLSRNINVISRCASAFRAEKLERLGISPSHYFYILAICKNVGISQDRLAKKLYLNKSSVARALQALEADGLVTRKHSETDRRITLVYPTEKAEALLPEIKQTAEEWNDFLFGALDGDERQQFTCLLQKITARAESYVDEKTEEQK